MSFHHNNSHSPNPLHVEPHTSKHADTNLLNAKSSALMVYNEDGTVAWEQMWDTFCALASAGEPPHRQKMLSAPKQAEPLTADYQRVVEELIRGIGLVSGLEAHHAKPGWLAAKCAHAAQARWMAEQIVQENIESYADGDFFCVPVASTYTISGEIKNIITVVAKTSHFWQEHLLNEVKRLMAWESHIVGAWRALSSPQEQAEK